MLLNTCWLRWSVIWILALSGVVALPRVFYNETTTGYCRSDVDCQRFFTNALCFAYTGDLRPGRCLCAHGHTFDDDHLRCVPAPVLDRPLLAYSLLTLPVVAPHQGNATLITLLNKGRAVLPQAWLCDPVSNYCTGYGKDGLVLFATFQHSLIQSLNSSTTETTAVPYTNETFWWRCATSTRRLYVTQANNYPASPHSEANLILPYSEHCVDCETFCGRGLCLSGTSFTCQCPVGYTGARCTTPTTLPVLPTVGQPPSFLFDSTFATNITLVGVSRKRTLMDPDHKVDQLLFLRYVVSYDAATSQWVRIRNETYEALALVSSPPTQADELWRWDPLYLLELLIPPPVVISPVNVTCSAPGTVFQNATHCVCASGYVGKFCEQLASVCQANQCHGHGRCEYDIYTQQTECLCQVGYFGRQCEWNITECATLRCNDHGSCASQLQGCECQAWHRGFDCSDGYCYTLKENVAVYNSTLGSCECVDASRHGPGCEYFKCGAGNIYESSSDSCECTGAWLRAPDTGNCSVHLCGTHGYPNPTNTSDCLCTAGYTNTRLGLSWCRSATECHGHGFPHGTTGECICDYPYSGEDCEKEPTDEVADNSFELELGSSPWVYVAVVVIVVVIFLPIVGVVWFL